MNNTASVVEYGVWGGKLFELTAKGQATLFEDGGSEKRSMFVHRVMLTDLKPGLSYGTDVTYGGWGKHRFYMQLFTYFQRNHCVCVIKCYHDTMRMLVVALLSAMLCHTENTKKRLSFVPTFLVVLRLASMCPVRSAEQI